MLDCGGSGDIGNDGDCVVLIVLMPIEIIIMRVVGVASSFYECVN